MIRRRVSLGIVKGKAESRARANRATLMRRDNGTPAQAEAAQARLDPLYGIAIVEDDPTAPDATFYAELASDVAPIVQDIGARADADSKPRKVASRKARREATPATVRKLRTADIMPRATLDPCPRCGRTDWRANGVGRQWHLDNYPGCAAQRKPDKHQYLGV